MKRLYRKSFDKVLDQCHVSIPYHDHTMINAMENPNIREDLWNLYRYELTGKCTAIFRRWLKFITENKKMPLVEGVLWNDLVYYYQSRREYEWWELNEKINWFDVFDADVWEQVLEGCEPLIKLFEEIKG